MFDKTTSWPMLILLTKSNNLLMINALDELPLNTQFSILLKGVTQQDFEQLLNHYWTTSTPPALPTFEDAK